jgi:hypothetical protein
MAENYFLYFANGNSSLRLVEALLKVALQLLVYVP